MDHTYGKWIKFNYWMALVFSVIFISLGLVLLIGSISLFRDNKISSAYNLFWNFISLAALVPAMFVFGAQLMSDVSIYEHGLQTTFLFKKLVVCQT